MRKMEKSRHTLEGKRNKSLKQKAHDQTFGEDKFEDLIGEESGDDQKALQFLDKIGFDSKKKNLAEEFEKINLEASDEDTYFKPRPLQPSGQKWKSMIKKN